MEGAPEGTTGDRSNPVPAGEIADIGDGYRLQVLSVVDDATDLILAENQFNDPPPEGSRFSIVEVALGYYGFDDPQFGLFTTVAAVGAGNTELPNSCGVTPNELEQFIDTFAGGVIRGNLCFVSTPADSGALQLYASTGFSGGDVFLDASASPTEPVVMPTLRGVQPGSSSEQVRNQPIPLATPSDVGEGWSVAATGPAVDITDPVMAENQFNEPPPEGFRFVGIPLRMEYGGEGSSNAFTVTTKAVGSSNVQYSTDCGVIPGELDSFTDVFAGGALEGQVCFVVPADDLGSEVLYAGAFLEEAVYFAAR